MNWSHIHLRLVNQLKVLPIGQLMQVPVEVEGLRTYAKFQVINFVNDTKPYLALFRIYLTIYNKTIINFKKIILSFEDSEMRVVAPNDPLEGQRYVELVNNEGQGNYLDQLYNIMSSKDGYMNPTVDGKLSWRNLSSCTSDSGDAVEN